MPIYEVTVTGSEKPIIVRAATAAKARDHVATVKALTAEELADAVSGGATIATAASKAD